MTHLRHPPGFQDGIAERLQGSGRSAGAVAALLDIDQRLFVWQRSVAKGETVQRMIAALGLGIEPAEYSALMAVSRITHGVGRTGPEPATVGALAGELALDPSRASRLAQQLIARGLVRREVAQEDGRKTILVLTDRAREVLVGIRDQKWDRYQATFAGWSDEDIIALDRLFGRFLDAQAAAWKPDAD
jgi:DNA-binding MarR family transcriptional regulator